MPVQPSRMAALRGRDHELRQLEAVLDTADSGGAQLVIIEGARGSGRTRLLGEVASMARARGQLVLEYQGGWGTATTHHLVAELIQVVGQVAVGEAPCVIAWDDPPWDDRAVVQALERSLPAATITWILTREVSPAPTQPAHRATCIELPPLNEAAAASMMADLLQATPDGDLLALGATAGGNPGALTELVTGLLDEGIVAVTQTARGRAIATLTANRLPRRTVGRLRHIVAGLSPAARHLVQVVAITPEPATVDSVAQLLNATVVALLPAITEATQASLFRHDSEEILFAHSLVRALVADSVPPAFRGSVPASPGGRLPLEDLTARQRKVAELVRQGLTDRQVANRLGVTPATVNYHLRQIFQKLGVHSRVELANRLTSPQPPAVA